MNTPEKYCLEPRYEFIFSDAKKGGEAPVNSRRNMKFPFFFREVVAGNGQAKGTVTSSSLNRRPSKALISKHSHCISQSSVEFTDEKIFPSRKMPVPR